MRRMGKLMKRMDLAILRLTMGVVVVSIVVAQLSLTDPFTATGVTFLSLLLLWLQLLPSRFRVWLRLSLSFGTTAAIAFTTSSRGSMMTSYIFSNLPEDGG